MDDNTKDQLAYEEAVMEIQKAVRQMKRTGVDFSNKANRKAFKNRLVDTMKRVVNDKRIFE